MPKGMSGSVNNSIKKEVTGLLRLAEEHTAPSGKRDLYEKVSDFFELHHQDLSAIERDLMADILRSLTHNVEMELRIRLAERLARNPAAPVELIVLLANDTIDVAHPVLLESKVLQDDELIKIIRGQTLSHQISVAARRELSESVSHEIIKTGHERAIIALLANQSARIANNTIEKLVEQSRTVETFQRPLLQRHDLPKAMALKMYDWVSDALKQVILQTQTIDKHELDSLLNDTVDGLKEEELARSDINPKEKLVTKLYNAKQLKPSFLMKSLSQGDTELFEYALAKLTNLELNLARQFTYDSGPISLAIVCRAVGIDQSVFMTIYRLTRKARGQTEELDPSILETAYDRFQNTDQRQAQLTLHKWAEEESRQRLF